MLVVTWNVLHRIHGVNWEEPTLARWPDEAARVASIAAYVGALEADVVCLQEVSGDQLAALRAVEHGTVVATAHSRVPRYWRRFEPAALREPEEYLVTLVRGAAAQLVGAATFETDAGKGYQHVLVGADTHVLTTHVSHGVHHAAQCALLAGRVAGTARVLVCGDFNADVETCAAALGSGLAAAAPKGSLPTRPRTTPSTKSQDIDHVFSRGLEARSAEVLDGEGRSDHNPLRARLG